MLSSRRSRLLACAGVVALVIIGFGIRLAGSGDGEGATGDVGRAERYAAGLIARQEALPVDPCDIDTTDLRGALGLSRAEGVAETGPLVKECTWSSGGVDVAVRAGADRTVIPNVWDRPDGRTVTIAGTDDAVEVPESFLGDHDEGTSIVLAVGGAFGIVEAHPPLSDPGDLEQLRAVATRLAAALRP